MEGEGSGGLFINRTASVCESKENSVCDVFERRAKVGDCTGSVLYGGVCVPRIDSIGSVSVCFQSYDGSSIQTHGCVSNDPFGSVLDFEQRGNQPDVEDVSKGSSSDFGVCTGYISEKRGETDGVDHRVAGIGGNDEIGERRSGDRLFGFFISEFCLCMDQSAMGRGEMDRGWRVSLVYVSMELFDTHDNVLFFTDLNWRVLCDFAWHYWHDFEIRYFRGYFSLVDLRIE